MLKLFSTNTNAIHVPAITPLKTTDKRIFSYKFDKNLGNIYRYRYFFHVKFAILNYLGVVLKAVLPELGSGSN